MLKNLTKNTTKKFYNKWLYKVTLDIPGISAIRIFNKREIFQFLAGPAPDYDSNPRWCFSRSKFSLWAHRDTVLQLFAELNGYQEKLDYGKRVEGNWIDLYTNNQELYEQLSIKFSSYIVHRYEPDPSTINLLEDSVFVVDKLPKGKYEYRVYLTPHKIKDTESRESFIEWMKGQRPRVTFTSAIEHWFRYTRTNWDRRYVLVEDEGTLLMMKLKSANAIGKVNKYVLTDK